MAKKLTRSIDDRWIAGICGGIAEYTGINSTLLRLILVVLTMCGFGSLILVYLIAWLIMPQEQPPSSIADPSGSLNP